ncbi:MAG: phenylalanine--tRNA ligase subunit beta [Patescibacteria group bacterium]|nr:phenylalanine--tRNA ligase subunit beta [Patescibacteria group bacterium]
MKISYNWLKEFVDINISPEDLAELLTMHSFEVENIIYQGKELDNVVVGEILEVKKHPDADRLNLVKVDVGNFGGLASSVEAKHSKSTILDIVCGAPNVEVGQKVAVASIGAELPGGFKIEKRKVRGVESCGMICAEDELGMGENHEGIMVLDKDSKIGTPLKKALNLDDVIFEIDILPNRAHDCLCHLGVAREVAAILKLKIKNLKLNENWKLEIGNCPNLDIKIENKDLCRRYSAVVVKNIEIKDSPVWLKSKLESCGVRSINNIVDITNFVMLAFGQPMHAFDMDKLGARYNNQTKIIIRRAKNGEKILALDENEYELNENDLVIADENKPIAIAGVMGGMDTAVDENTKNIIFEAANFDCTNIRKTAQRLKLSSESSYRFEREIDPEMTILAMVEATGMAKDLANGKVEENITDIYDSPMQKKEIEFEFKRIKNLLGVEVGEKEVVRILKALDFEVEMDDEIIKVKVPTYRIDIEMTNDIIEEIGRIYGYKNISEVAGKVEMKSVACDRILSLEKDIRIISEGLGFCEIYNYSFVSEKDLSDIGFKIEDYLELQNPLSEEHKFMRMSILPYLLKNVEKNLKYQDNFALFEIGRVYLKNDNKLPDEKRIFAGVMVDKNAKDTLFYELKGRMEILLSKLEINEVNFQEAKSAEHFWHKGRSAEIVYKNKIIGKIGEIHPTVSDAFGVETRVSYFEIYEESLLEFYSKEKDFQKINKFPAVELDLSVIFDEDVKWGDIKKAVFATGGKLVKSVVPFDIYRRKEIGEDKKSVAFRISYQAEDRTLKDEEVGIAQEKVIEELGKMGGEVRK